MTLTLTDAEHIIAEQRNDIRILREAIRLTREYVGETMLPAEDGWTWYEAIKATGDCEGFGHCGCVLNPAIVGYAWPGNSLKHCSFPTGHQGPCEDGED